MTVNRDGLTRPGVARAPPWRVCDEPDPPPLRPGDRPPGGAGVRRARRRAALPARRHRDRRAPRHATAGRARRRRDRCSPRRSASSTSSPTRRPRAVARQLGAGQPAGRGRAAASTAAGSRSGLGLVLAVLGARARAADRRRDGRVGRGARRSRSRTCGSACSAHPLHAARARRGGLPPRHAGHADDARDRGRRQRREPRPRAAVRLRARPRHRRVGLGHRASRSRRRGRVPRDRRRRSAPARERVAPAATPRACEPDAPSSAGRLIVRTASLLVAFLATTAIAARISRRRRRRAPDRVPGVHVPRAVARRARDRGPGDGRALPRAPTTRTRRGPRRGGCSSGAWSSASASASRSRSLRPWLVPALHRRRRRAGLAEQVLWSSPRCSRSPRSSSCSTASSSAPATRATSRGDGRRDARRVPPRRVSVVGARRRPARGSGARSRCGWWRGSSAWAPASRTALAGDRRDAGRLTIACVSRPALSGDGRSPRAVCSPRTARVHCRPWTRVPSTASSRRAGDRSSTDARWPRSCRCRGRATRLDAERSRWRRRRAGAAASRCGRSPAPLYDPIYRHWFRAEWEGLEHIPREGGALLVANHAGAIPSDAPVIMHGIETELGRPVYGLAENLFRALPVIGTLWSRTGGVPAHPDNAYRLLHDDQQLVLVFPEGTKGPASTSATATSCAASGAAASSRSRCAPACPSCRSRSSATRSRCRSSSRASGSRKLLEHPVLPDHREHARVRTAARPRAATARRSSGSGCCRRCTSTCEPGPGALQPRHGDGGGGADPRARSRRSALRHAAHPRAASWFG